MYKLLLCWRYLRTRYIALICIISVTLGVATMIVVNSVMAGFATSVEGEMNSMLGDLTLQARNMDGVPDAAWHMAQIKEAVGDSVVGMSPMVAVYAQIYMQVNGNPAATGVMLVGIDEKTFSMVCGVGEHFQHPANRRNLSFDLRESGYDEVDHEAKKPERKQPRPEFASAGWVYRRARAEQDRDFAARIRQARASAPGGSAINDPFATKGSVDKQGVDFNPAKEQHVGLILALSECSYRDQKNVTRLVNRPGDDVRVVMPTSSLPPQVLSGFYTIVDMHADTLPMGNATMAFVPLAHLQKSRGMIDRTTGVGRFTSIQIKLREGADVAQVRDRLREIFNPQLFLVNTWKDNQGALVNAVQMETAVLNILLFLIVAVAGFGILAIFYMIVTEKTRDIGILKSLGASSAGVMGIFLSYGLSLGIVGAGAGTILGVAFAWNINEIADLLEWIQGAPVFDASVYFFEEIPAVIDPWTVAWIAAGAVGIATLASILPARRAASLHPVRALRFE